MGELITLLGVVLSQLMIGFLLNNNLAPIGFSVISTCSPADHFEQRARNVPLASADVRGGGRLCHKPKESLRRSLAIVWIKLIIVRTSHSNTAVLSVLTSCQYVYKFIMAMPSSTRL